MRSIVASDCAEAGDANDSAQATFVVFRPQPGAADRNVSEGDLKKYYEAHKAEFDRPARAVL